ncbi:hypothetical protein CBM2633_P380031 [Cupriavidus taiwanensis]|uniref:Uncharacterized protein n=2 Tax=Cupriavidus TaxID=106589 RepID=A0A375CSG9_9BURK|nr:hypothetical protein CBM2585_P380030 [Cupriavidus taiwanensis]SOZ40711.1 hypothetical protein CBM2605_P380032 [Cupriavidus neocaledonicus]SOY76631.1 hypothetical protein CBM2588_P420032 [Cupriavidus taiwanensis]SOY76684.1 hypothetical protein CBM2592_P400029 [Cupriavidus taiwanensis]SOY76989.1 hypothetical protein CBM2589_P380030 [Cupriavidus taiwanensis]
MTRSCKRATDADSWKTTDLNTVTNRLDLFEHSRDVMLRNDVLAALEQRDHRRT